LNSSSRLAWLWQWRPTNSVLLLAVLSLWDLRIELQLLAQQFTLTALREAVLAHPLAITVLLLLPMLQRLTCRQGSRLRS